MAAPFAVRASRGFTLVEILVVVVILGLILAMGAVLLRSITATQKRAVTASRLANVEAALVQFVMQQRRLPCPADGTQSVSAGGTEVIAGGVCTGAQKDGVVPWRTLGLSHADATDGWDRRITYRVGSALVGADALNLSWCDPAGTGGLAGTVCNNACTAASLASCTPPSTYITAKGLTVKNLAGTDLMVPAGVPPTGAAYVLISHGESGGGAYLESGALATSTTTDGNEEQKNYANLPLAAYYVDDQIVDVGGTSHFDDVVVRPTIISVASKAGLGPRSH
jgi:prepilin-type N-terminal cleavage/methylation domain-containing protein